MVTIFVWILGMQLHLLLKAFQVFLGILIRFTITDDIIDATDNSMATIVVLLDMSKAFDSIEFELMSAKLICIGIRDAPWEWYRNYLQDRKQCVELKSDHGQKTSEYLTLKSGVPQGSILGPHLFNIFVTDLEGAVKQYSIHYYADDILLKFSFKASDLDTALDLINKDLNNLYACTASNSLKINAAKTDANLFGSKKVKSVINKEIALKINDEIIKVNESVKNLGVVMDDKLSYMNHVNNLHQTAYIKLKSLYHFKNYLTKEAKLKPSDSLVLSRFNYCDSVYGPCITAANSNIIQKVQNFCVRFSFEISYREHISPHLRNIGWMDIRTRRWVHLCCLVYKVMKYETPEYLSRKLEKRSEAHTVMTRRRETTLSIPAHSTVYFKKSFSYQAAKIYNQIALDLRTCH